MQMKPGNRLQETNEHQYLTLTLTNANGIAETHKKHGNTPEHTMLRIVTVLSN